LKVALIFPGRRDYRFLDSHRTSIPASNFFRLDASHEIGSGGQRSKKTGPCSSNY